MLRYSIVNKAVSDGLNLSLTQDSAMSNFYANSAKFGFGEGHVTGIDVCHKAQPL